MADDVVFLVTGQPPMRKAEFAATARAQVSGAAPQVEGSSDIQEIRILGDWAFMWQQLRVTATPPGGGQPTVRAGHTLTVFSRQDGRWLLSRDANMLALVDAGPGAAVA